MRKLVKKLALGARTLTDSDAFAESVTQTDEKLENEHRDKLLTWMTPSFQDFHNVQLSAA